MRLSDETPLYPPARVCQSPQAPLPYLRQAAGEVATAEAGDGKEERHRSAEAPLQEGVAGQLVALDGYVPVQVRRDQEHCAGTYGTRSMQGSL